MSLRARFLALFSALALGSGPALADLESRIYVDFEETAVMKAGAASEWILEYFDPSVVDQPHHFHIMHEKEVHLVIVSEDLKTFAHVHPYRLANHNALFGLKVNAPTLDPDNLDLATAVQLPGRYYLFSEIMPHGWPMTLLSLDLTAEGPARKLEPVELSPMNARGEIELTQSVGGLDYRLAVVPETYPHCGTFMLAFNARLQSRESGTSGEWQDVKDLQTYLGAYGHAIIVSEAGKTAATKQVRHLHAVWPLADDPGPVFGPTVEITADNHGVMPEGIFKAWIQLKHRGHVLTFPLGLDVRAPVGPGVMEFFSAKASRC